MVTRSWPEAVCEVCGWRGLSPVGPHPRRCRECQPDDGPQHDGDAGDECPCEDCAQGRRRRMVCDVCGREVDRADCLTTPAGDALVCDGCRGLA